MIYIDIFFLRNFNDIWAMLSICCQLGSSIVSKKLRGTICMVKMALWFYATLSSNFPLFWVAFVQKACSSFVFFREERLHMRSKLLVCIRGGVGNLLGFQKFIKKSLGWVGTNTWVSGIAYFACRYPYAFVKRERPRSTNFSW